MSAKLIQVIETDMTERVTGFGLENDRVRRVVKEYWDTDGNKLAEFDLSYPHSISYIDRILEKLREIHQTSMGALEDLKTIKSDQDIKKLVIHLEEIFEHVKNQAALHLDNR